MRILNRLDSGRINEVKHMSTIYQTIIKADVNKPLVRHNVGGILACGDDAANLFGVELYRDGERLDASGKTVSAYFIRPNDDTVLLIGKAEGSVVHVILDKSCYAYDGAFSLAIKISDSQSVQTVAIFDGRMNVTRTDNVIDNENTIPSLEEIYTAINQIETLLPRIEQSFDDVSTAVSNANEAANNAGRAAEYATIAGQNANLASGYLTNTTVSATKLAPGSNPTAVASTVNDHMHIAFGLVTGEKGEQGESYTIKGHAYATLAELQADVTNPSVGDQYNVGAGAPYNIYRWTGSAWEDQGQLRGARGFVFTPSVSEDGVISWTNDGNLDNPASVSVRGERGEKGEQGAPYMVKGSAYPSVSALQAAVPNPAEGDQYNVGTSTPYNIYRWTGSSWEDQGQLRGAPGCTFTPVVSSDGVLSWTNDGGLDNPASVNIKGERGEKGEQGTTGKTGAAGYTPVRGTDYWTAADIATIKSYVDDAILNGAW